MHFNQSQKLRKTYRKNVRPDAISVGILIKCLNSLTRHVESKISKLLPPKFAWVFDVLTIGTVHYMAMFSSYPAENTEGNDTRLMSLFPLCHEYTSSADEHHEFIACVLELYGRS